MGVKRRHDSEPMEVVLDGNDYVDLRERLVAALASEARLREAARTAVIEAHPDAAEYLRCRVCGEPWHRETAPACRPTCCVRDLVAALAAAPAAGDGGEVDR